MSAVAPREAAVQRLASANGHLAAVLAMTRGGAPCGDLIFQLRAVRGAIEHVERTLIEEHIRHCIERRSHLTNDVVDEILALWSYAPPAKQGTRTRLATNHASDAPRPPTQPSDRTPKEIS